MAGDEAQPLVEPVRVGPGRKLKLYVQNRIEGFSFRRDRYGLGNVIQGRGTTLPVTLDDSIYHTAAVIRGTERVLCGEGSC